ncbi:MAG TPA: GtrA family protein [Pirellulales bacterium]|nr:GtrA family protein [Pirellulales bacterium]
MSICEIEPLPAADASGLELAPLASATLAPAADLPLVVQMARYLVVGGVAFVADFGALYVLTEFGHIHYLESAAIAFLFGMAVNYVLSVSWVFQVRAVKSQRLEFLLFALIGLVGLGFNQLLLRGLTEGLAVYYLHAKLITTGVVLAWNFAARKLLLFTSPRPSGTEEPVHS